jgi:hypothetical protein
VCHGAASPLEVAAPGGVQRVEFDGEVILEGWAELVAQIDWLN